MKISIIAAMTPGNHVIGKNNSLPWRLPSDLKRFKELTTGKPVIMGRKTYESIGKPLPNRTNVVITSQRDYQAPGCAIVHNFGNAIDLCKGMNVEEVMVIGGSQIYGQALIVADRLLISFVLGPFSGDTHFPEIGGPWTLVSSEYPEPSEKDDCPHTFCVFERDKKEFY